MNTIDIEQLATTKISEIMQRRVVTVSLDDTLEHARALCDQQKIHHVLVTDGPRVAGIVSYGDILKNLSPYAGKEMSECELDRATLNRKVHQIMTRQLVSATEETSLSEAAELLIRHGVAALPVLSSEMRLLGIVTWKDLLCTAFQIDKTHEALVANS